MKNTILRILVYTLVFSLLIDLYKIFIQNNLFNNDYSNAYFIAMATLKGLLFTVTLFLLSYEKIKISDYNKNKYILIVVALIIFFWAYNNVVSGEIKFKIQIDYLRLSIFTVFNLFIGLFEEFYFRLFVFVLLCSYYKKNLFKICILTSFLFAIVHSSNLILNSYNFSDVLFQIMFAFATGLFLQIVFINFKNIYIPVLIHALIDFNNKLSQDFFKVLEKENSTNSFDYTTFYIMLIFIALSLIFAYFNLKKKDISYFQNKDNFNQLI